MRQVRRAGFVQLQGFYPQAISRRVPLRKKAHLCPDCAEDLRKWMKGCQFADAGALREVVDELECAYRPEDYASVDALCELSNDASKALAKRIRKAVGL